MNATRLIEKAIRAAGSERKLALACEVSQTAIWKAKKAGRVSPTLAAKIEIATGGAVTRRELCPTVFFPTVGLVPVEGGNV